jgi:fatty-acid peroxygenase
MDAHAGEPLVVLHAMQQVLCGAVCEWAGIPVSETDVPRRAREFAAMIGGAGAFGPRNWHGMLLRSRTERWARDLVARVRAGSLAVEQGSALHRLAAHVDADGAPLTREVAAVELLNLLRPTVAVAWYLVHVAHALHGHPAWRERLCEDHGHEAEAFVNEVRRWYAFFPVIGGRVREPFEWQGARFDTGDWVLLDIYGTHRDSAAWEAPERFDPDRFAGWRGHAFSLVPQGGGDHHADHRCPGEWITIALMARFARVLARQHYHVPPQDLELDLRHPPAAPRSGFVIETGVTRR